MIINNREVSSRTILEPSLRDSSGLKQNEANSLSITDLFTSRVPVAQRAFYDLGFDPDFSVDGDFFYKKYYSFGLLKSIINKIIALIKQYMSFSQSPGVEKNQENFLQELLKIEKNWQKTAQAQGMLYQLDKDDLNKSFWQGKAPFLCELQEHLFFKKLSEVAKLGFSKNVYASELLKPLHKFNRPQKCSHQSKQHILQDGENDDVGRLTSWGFVLLDNHHAKKYKDLYIPHRDFLRAVDQAGNQLKHSIRDLRTAVRKQDYQGFAEKFRIFDRSWNQYVESHELLQNLSFIYSKKDFFEDSYQRLEKLYQRMQDPSVYQNEELYIELNQEFQHIFDLEKSSEKLYNTVLAKLPNSGTAKIIIARKNDFSN